MKKPIKYSDLADKIKQEKENGHKIVLTGGCFDLPHRGHIYLFDQAKKYGDILVVNVVNDNRVKFYKGPDRPIHDQYERAGVVAGAKGVDYATIHPEENSSPLLALAGLIAPDIVVKNKNKKWTKQELSDLEKKLGYIPKFIDVPSIKYKKSSTTNTIDKIRKIFEKNSELNV